MLRSFILQWINLLMCVRNILTYAIYNQLYGDILYKSEQKDWTIKSIIGVFCKFIFKKFTVVVQKSTATTTFK